MVVLKKNRIQLLLEITNAVIDAVGKDKTGSLVSFYHF